MSAARVAVLGAGANGAGIGADLVRAGHDVTFIEQWPAHVEAMRQRGIRVEMPEETVTTPVTVHHLCEVAELREPFDLVFVLVKAYDTRWASELIRPLVADDGLVVGLQNGMELDHMADIIGAERTLGAVIEVSSNMFEPGVVERQSPPSTSWFAIGSMHPSTIGREEEAASVLRAAGTVEISADIRSSKWMKLVANAAELVPSAILDLPLGDAVRLPGMREFMIATGREAVRTCLATGSRLMPIFGMTEADIAEPDDYAVTLLDRVLTDYTLPSTRTTVLQDWMKGRRSEVNEINGLVVREQLRLGGSAPLNERVVELALRIEAGTLDARPENLALLLAD
ncbi:ketopantoate reductase family protein [Microcella humidisoli]|uniref:2-dehydropantoate 2-reductase n=1 Tax=Microcella humidisoli TaxID=2963406 RepID=A0ABY5FYV6_9MICO|nr:2-dehydropantoate 2-reductase [Microcella humidisoli]UTT63107.1 2-dehydropantoate 2-reductase [Microcella humidisoli]